MKAQFKPKPMDETLKDVLCLLFVAGNVYFGINFGLPGAVFFDIVCIVLAVIAGRIWGF